MSIYSTHKPQAEGGGLYLKIEDGQTVKVRIFSDPAIYESVFKRGEEVNISTRYGWLVWNQETNRAQILQMGVRFFRSIAALAQDDEWGDPMGYDIKITRQGEGPDTTYNITPSANREPLPLDARESLKKIDLLDKLRAGQSSQRVMWLSEWDKMAEEAGLITNDYGNEIEALEAHGNAKRGIDKARETAENIRAAKTSSNEDIGDEPINLDHLPW